MDMKKLLDPVGYYSNILLLKFYTHSSKSNKFRLKPSLHLACYVRNLIYILYCTLHTLCVFILFEIQDKWSTNVFIKTVQLIYHFYRVPLVVLLIIVTYLVRRRLLRFLNKSIDLDYVFSSYGYKNDYTKRRNLIYSLITIILLQNLSRIYAYFIDTNFSCYKYQCLMRIFLQLTIQYSITCNIVNWLACQLILKKHFQLLNDYFSSAIAVRNQKNEKELIFVQSILFHKKNEKKILMDKLQNVYIMYNKLCIQMEILNLSFAWQILLIMPFVFILMTVRLFEICKMIGGLLNYKYYYILECIYGITDIFGIILPVSRTTDEAEHFRQIIKNIDMSLEDDSDIHEMINLISLQALHLPLENTAYGIFSLNRKLIFSMISGIATYLIMLLQNDTSK